MDCAIVYESGTVDLREIGFCGDLAKTVAAAIVGGIERGNGFFPADLSARDPLTILLDPDLGNDDDNRVVFSISLRAALTDFVSHSRGMNGWVSPASAADAAKLRDALREMADMLDKEVVQASGSGPA